MRRASSCVSGFFFLFHLGFLGSEESMGHVGKYSFPESPLGKDRCGPGMVILSFETVSMYAVSCIISSLPFAIWGKSCRLLIFTFFSLHFVGGWRSTVLAMTNTYTKIKRTSLGALAYGDGSFFFFFFWSMAMFKSPT